LKNCITTWLEQLWQKSVQINKLFFFEKIIFYFLCVLEKNYQAIFFCVNFLKKKSGGYRVKYATVISVGNLSVGGTGKSVFVQFLVKEFCVQNKNSAIFLRGYKSNLTRTGESFLICDGKEKLYDPKLCGDEAYMLAEHLQVPIVIGKNRVASHRKLKAFCQRENSKIDYIFLDDAYQNHSLKKDFEILLLDARRPFENGHCLPAGRLREKDYSRADIIVLTHADSVSQKRLHEVKSRMLMPFEQTKIFAGKHKTSGIFLQNSGEDQTQFLRKKNVLVFAGIGSIDGFVQSVKETGVVYATVLEYKDHYSYTLEDFKIIMQNVKKYSCIGAITTAKDWVKIKPLLSQLEKHEHISLYILNVEFEFLSNQEYSSFMRLMHKKF